MHVVVALFTTVLMISQSHDSIQFRHVVKKIRRNVTRRKEKLKGLYSSEVAGQGTRSAGQRAPAPEQHLRQRHLFPTLRC